MKNNLKSLVAFIACTVLLIGLSGCKDRSKKSPKLKTTQQKKMPKKSTPSKKRAPQKQSSAKKNAHQKGSTHMKKQMNKSVPKSKVNKKVASSHDDHEGHNGHDHPKKVLKLARKKQ